MLASCAKKKSNTSTVLARVDEDVLFVDNLKKNGYIDSRTISTEIEDWVNETTLFQEAIKMGLDKDSSIIKMRDDFFRKAIISSFIEKSVTPKIEINKDSIRSYYEKNKGDFIRNEKEIFVQHFAAQNISTAKNIIKNLKKETNNNDINIDIYLKDSKTVKEGSLPLIFDKKLFESKKNIIGPINAYSNYHVFNVLGRFDKGSYIGFDLAYEIIYQRFYKKREANLSYFLLDSLKQSKTIFINSRFE